MPLRQVRDNIPQDDMRLFLDLNFSHMGNFHFYQRRWPFLFAILFATLFASSCENRADPAPMPPQLPAFEFLGAWGDKGDGPGKLNAPVAFAADSLGRVFFADPGAGFVHKFESTGTPLLSFDDSRVHHASGIAVDSCGAIYIADAARGKLRIFFPGGTLLLSMRIAPQRHFSGPLGISLDSHANLSFPSPS